ncbi:MULTISPECIES: DNA-binding protein [Peribacillus]|uniref:DNA-binding protein n=1 Tax=Peribacillus TaxID=2675229 RepID=UPI001F4DF075|nr:MULTISPECIES: DNA-binding protein [unclassified Peribacillus]MCK1986264.1 DNA-binding protein [Peribacillus sp. Aquil_B1]MCK2010379.1 DNA-binding protein [Peribacillus sp. Aquil_B8]
MIEIKLDENELRTIYLEEVQKRLDKIQFETLLMDSKQLCKMLSLSWPSIEKLFLSDPNFPSMRVGTKWLFNRKEVQEYIDQWSVQIKVKK